MVNKVFIKLWMVILVLIYYLVKKNLKILKFEFYYNFFDIEFLK